jgi:hypothetical protein
VIPDPAVDRAGGFPRPDSRDCSRVAGLAHAKEIQPARLRLPVTHTLRGTIMTSQSDVRTPAPDPTQPLKRRGMLAAGIALVAGLVAKLTEQPVSAGVDGDVVLGALNNASSITIISTGATSQTAMQLISGTGSTGTSGLVSTGQYHGVEAYGGSTASGGAGVFGQAERVEASGGVHGRGFSTAGVRGESDSMNGVLGLSASGVPVFGQVTPGSSANTIAIYGQNYSTYAGPSPGAGGFGVYGISAKGHGLVGATAAAGGAAVVGATNGVVGAYAAAFYGPVIIGGNFTVVGGAKSAAVPHPDGSHRRLYCMESPESWFEDFGTGQLECGRAEVAIDPDFAAMVRLDAYQVFLTQYDQHNDLCVTDRTPTGFRVQAKDSAADGGFGWRVVAKRKDIAGDRLETVTIPAAPILPPVPDIPTPTPPTPRHQR